MKLFSSLHYFLPICRIDHEDDCIDLIEIMLPETRRLATYVPQRERQPSIGDLLDIKSHGWHGIPESFVFQLEKQCALARIIKTKEEHFLVCTLIRGRRILHFTQLT